MLIGSRLNKVFLTLMILVSLWLLGRSTTGLDGTEFSGGRLTGPMLDTCECSQTRRAAEAART
jgi:hypothetical protein